MPAVKMWKPQIETASRSVIADSQFRLFKSQVRYVYDQSPMYKRKCDEVGFNPSDVKTPEDISKVPFTTKQDLLKSQEENPPYGDFLCIPAEEGVRLFKTSGTTGQPLVMLFSPRDWFGVICDLTAYGAYNFGIEKADIAFFPFNYSFHVAWWVWQATLEALGTMVIPGGSQSSEERIRNLIAWKATIICGTPTYLIRLGEIARAMGIDLAGESRIRVVIASGEPGGQIPATRKVIESTWGAKCYDAFGISEMPSIGFECLAQKGVHINETGYLAEVINPETNEPVRSGEQGELVVTNLSMELMPLIRYRTKDIVKLSSDTCDCGRTTARLEGGIIGRSDDMITFGGVNVFPSAIENFLRSMDQFSNEFQIIVPKMGTGKRLSIRIEPASEAVTESVLNKGVNELVQTIKWKIGLTPEIEITRIGTLPRFELKAKRVIRDE